MIGIPDIEVVNHQPPRQVRPDSVVALALQVIHEEQLPLQSLSIIFVNDAFLRKLHSDYLDDDSVTDIMTFNLGSKSEIEGELYISVDRATAHAAEFKVSLAEELTRLVIHGLLHLKGYDDQTAAERQVMRRREQHYLDKNERRVELQPSKSDPLI